MINKVPEGSLIIQDLGGIEAEPCCCGYLLSFHLNLDARGKWGRDQESLHTQLALVCSFDTN